RGHAGVVHEQRHRKYGEWVPLHMVSAGANHHDSPLLSPTLAGVAKLGPRPEDSTVSLKIQGACSTRPTDVRPILVGREVAVADGATTSGRARGLVPSADCEPDAWTARRAAPSRPT